MKANRRETTASFDEYAVCYDEALHQGLSLSGENKEYFAQKRVAWLARCLQATPRRIMDYGCGTGSSTPYLLELDKCCSILGVDLSRQSLAVAARNYGSARISYCSIEECKEEEWADLAFCNGVFHHIAPEERAAALHFIYRCLRPGGYFAFWENNPWNPGTRLVMSRIPFDRDAVPIPPSEGRNMLGAAGFELQRNDFLFYFPRCFSWLRGLERFLARLPFGAQYLLLSRKPLGRANPDAR